MTEQPTQPSPPTNPLDDLQQFDSSTSIPVTKRVHSSGRRELRAANYARGISITARPKTVDDKTKAIQGGMIETLPIKRAKEKRDGMTKKEWKRARKAARESASESARRAASESANNPQE